MDPPAPDGLAARLFADHGHAVRRYFHRLTRRPDVADDLSQEVYLRIVRGAGRYEPRERERAWVFRIARNVLLDHYRRAGRSPEESRPAEPLGGPSQTVAVDVQQALAALSADDRDAFLLGEVGGLTYAEIANVLGMTVPGVRSRIYRARLALREALTPPPPLGDRVVMRYDDED